MSVYVDKLVQYPKVHGHEWWCHMMADCEDELDVMAQRIGLKPEWFQKKSMPHYDLTPTKRELAIEEGAIEISSENMVRHFTGGGK